MSAGGQSRCGILMPLVAAMACSGPPGGGVPDGMTPVVLPVQPSIDRVLRLAAPEG
jgi:hypothetical protein